MLLRVRVRVSVSYWVSVSVRIRFWVYGQDQVLGVLSGYGSGLGLSPSGLHLPGCHSLYICIVLETTFPLMDLKSGGNILFYL